MKTVFLEKDLCISAPNQPGIAWQLSHMLAEQAKTNLKFFWGNSTNSNGEFFIIPENFELAKDTLDASEYSNYQEDDVLVIKVDNKPGICAEMLDTIRTAGLNIKFVVTTIFDNKPAVVVKTDDNRKAYQLFT